MRILHFVPNISLKSGIINMIMNYYRELRLEGRNDITFDFVFFEKDPDRFFEKEINSYGGRIFLVSKPSPGSNFFRDWEKVCKENFGKYDILHIHLPFLNFLFHKAKKELGVKKIISHAHVTQLGDKLFTRVRNRTMYFLGAHVPDSQFACSQKAGTQIFGKSFQKKGHVINNAINVEKFVFNSETRKKVRQYYHVEDKFVIGHIGRFSKQKNHSLLIDIFDCFVRNNPNSVLMLVGEGPLEEKIQQKVVRLGLRNKVIFLGQRKNVNELVQSFDYFLFPSYYEGLGITLIEAQASGVPCLISNTIPTEASVLPTTKKLPLSDQPNVWADNIDISCERFSDAIVLIDDSGFNIKLESLKLIQNYKDIL